VTLEISGTVMRQIQKHGEKAYPEEGAGLLLGRVDGVRRRVDAILILPNVRGEGERKDRYLLSPQDYIEGEEEALRRGLDVLGIFHSHPDHPNRPSEYDRQWALPWFSYVITSVMGGRAGESRSWRLSDDREAFSEEPIKNSATTEHTEIAEKNDTSA
jgi:proteasome lid subunit RPN8/RPN11